jgi:hypothetical protein
MRTINPAFAHHPKEADIVGRLVLSFGEMEYLLSFIAAWNSHSTDEMLKVLYRIWAQLDLIRANTQSEKLPAPARAPALASNVAEGMNYCPQCHKLRHSSVAACIYCGSTAPVEVPSPT